LTAFPQRLLQQVLSQNRPAITNLVALFGVVEPVVVNLTPVVVEVVVLVAQFLCLQVRYQQPQR
jgi:hypothetical protein